jgi:hypothetical protein
MKKLLTAFLAMAFLVGSLGCPKDTTKKPDVKKPDAAAGAATTPTTTPPAPADTKGTEKPK